MRKRKEKSKHQSSWDPSQWKLHFMEKKKSEVHNLTVRMETTTPSMDQCRCYYANRSTEERECSQSWGDWKSPTRDTQTLPHRVKSTLTLFVSLILCKSSQNWSRKGLFFILLFILLYGHSSSLPLVLISESLLQPVTVTLYFSLLNAITMAI